MSILPKSCCGIWAEMLLRHLTCRSLHAVNTSRSLRSHKSAPVVPLCCSGSILVTETKCAFCQVGTQVPCFGLDNDKCRGSRGQSPATLCGDTRFILVGLVADKWHWGRLFCPFFCFPCRFHPTNALYSSSSTSCSYKKDERAKPGNRQTACYSVIL